MVALYAVLGILGGLLLIFFLNSIYIGYRFAFGPFKKLGSKKPGNRPQYDLDKVKPLADSPLKGKSICFLGSSVTYGAASGGVAFPDYLAKRDGIISLKEAVSGTTLADIDDTSYIARLKKIDVNQKFDLFICQLSTNDANKKLPIGEKGTTDTKTVRGAIEFIIKYARENFKCPIAFYTSPDYHSKSYRDLVDLLKEIQSEENIYVIDLFSAPDFPRIIAKEDRLYMSDPIHPTKAGYLLWWTPYFEKKISEIFGSEKK
jgi:lysophospholipase L1-like esterase